MLRLSLGHNWRPTVTSLRHDSSIQTQRRADLLIFQHLPDPNDLVLGLQKWVIAVNGRVPAFHHVLDLADRCGSDILDALDMLRNEPEMMGINVARLDEAFGLLRTAAGIFLVDQTTLVVDEAVEVAAGARQALTEVVGGHFQNFAANRVADAEDLTEREDQPLLAVQAEQHPHCAADLGFFD